MATRLPLETHAIKAPSSCRLWTSNDLIQMLVARARQPTADLISERLAEFQRPLSHALVADDDAARGQHFLDHAQAEREAEIKPNRVTDDLGRKPVAGAAGGGRR